MAASERKKADYLMSKANGNPINVIRNLAADSKYNAPSFKRMVQYILMKNPNSRSTRKKKVNIKPVGGNTPAAAFPVAAPATPAKKDVGGTRKKTAKGPSFFKRLFD